MRLSEVAHLRLADIDRNRRLITIRAGKGKKDRVVMLSEKIEAYIDEYLAHYTPMLRTCSNPVPTFGTFRCY